MERYYLVQVMWHATASNPNFSGEEHIALYGKRDTLMFLAQKNGPVQVAMLTAACVRQYAYRRKQDAVRSWTYTHMETGYPYWTKDARIVEAIVQEDGMVLWVD